MKTTTVACKWQDGLATGRNVWCGCKQCKQLGALRDEHEDGLSQVFEDATEEGQVLVVVRDDGEDTFTCLRYSLVGSEWMVSNDGSGKNMRAVCKWLRNPKVIR